MSAKPTTKLKENPFTKRREPLGFMLWLGVVGSSLLFTSIFIIFLVRVQRETGHMMVLPDMFWLSTLVILFSSITLHEANLAFASERFLHYRVFLGATLVLGITFILLQVGGWAEMLNAGVFEGVTTSSGLVYLLTGLHLVHIVAGVIYLSILFQKAIKNRTYIDSFIYSVNAPNKLKIKLLTRYWHFTGALWLVVFLFLIVLY
ncbi:MULTISPECIES: heme-copper oxidase subunit III [unclassified Dyadobacter]|uniref:cytochrome c oxidase subunit 3 n=1 Tax=unclassified Dyadobacter TaxID=2625061 RepID=UPI001F416721|nr:MULTISPECIES: heme-copper oxidase subunit III [unclassified Dyadobacter]MCE7068947.1 heme-copper oxidase subunit III [Dyadobacter sp. CY327]MCF2520256.1 heme-copper oxidase subunit III [Dyadobacter sp. CY351]